MNVGSICVEEMERRRARRLPIRVRVRYADTDEFLADREANISGYGMYIPTDDPLDVGVRFRLCFDVEGLPGPVETVAEVRWNQMPGDPLIVPGMGVMFQKLAPKDQADIDRLLVTT